MQKILASLVLVIALASTNSQASWLVRRERSLTDGSVKLLSVENSKQMLNDGESERVLRSFLKILREDAPPSKTIFEQVLVASLTPEMSAKLQEPRTQMDADTEVRTLVNQGPKENRINLTIVGDGYTLAEKAKFFEDAQRITDDLFREKTYSTYLPLFNVYAVFVPSNESGISDIQKKDTALGLYRDPPGSKRAIMPGNDRAIQDALSLAPATDYPILIANDDYYGGLGGEYAITTRSIEGGPMVLRHELGHNFGQVGEEYDGGYVYAGANSSGDSTGAEWKHWWANGSHLNDAQFLSGAYVWQKLENHPYSVKFDFPQPTRAGAFSFEVILSSVGWATADDVYAYLDGTKVGLVGHFTRDRSFFGLDLNRTLAAGPHTLEVRENIHDGDNMLAFAEIYANASDYDYDRNHVASYATFDVSKTKTFRPTRNICLMRDIQSKEFCPVDYENMWGRFLNKVNLIDAVTVSGDTVEVKAPALNLELHWFEVDANGNEREIVSNANQRKWVTHQAGSFRVKAAFRTDQVRKVTARFDAAKDFTK